VVKVAAVEAASAEGAAAESVVIESDEGDNKGDDEDAYAAFEAVEGLLRKLHRKLSNLELICIYLNWSCIGALELHGLFDIWSGFGGEIHSTPIQSFHWPEELSSNAWCVDDFATVWSIVWITE